ncbi:RNA polymerase sigma factor RpoD [hydrothermal vent metagenome]|uniref:RNA polymerase sigma factor RpoD n=1 Tax=hydrothermal vent metagenome TaxID=652676 RepID=A0A3B1BTD8_9ZZZZ
MVKERSSNFDSDPLKTYLHEISSITPLSREEEQRLARLGDEKSLHKLVERNLKYVVMVAHHYKGLGVSLADLINEGNLGMIEASRRFDPDRGVKFITYAVWWVRQSILRALAEQSRAVRLPVKQAGLLKKIACAIGELSFELKREPAMDEIANKIGIKLKALETIMWVYRGYMSLDTPLSDEEGSASFIDMLESDPEHSVEADFFRLCLHHDVDMLLGKLKKREEEVLRMRYGFDEPPMTLEKIGRKLNLTRERVRQIEKVAKGKMRSKSQIKILEDYLR